MSAPWPDEDLERLRRLRAERMTGREIHAVMPWHSRNAIIVKARRLGIPLLGAHTMPGEGKPPRKERRPLKTERVAPEVLWAAALAGRTFRSPAAARAAA